MNNCTCCQPTTEVEVIVPLVCSDGFSASKAISVPTGCDCLACVTEDAHDPRYQVEQFEQSHAALVQQEAPVQQEVQVSPDDVFGAPQAQAQLAPEVSAEDIFGAPQVQVVPERLKESIGEVPAQDIFGAPQAQIAPQKSPKKPVAEVTAQDIFGIPNSEVQLAPARSQQSNLVPENNQHGEIFCR